MTKAAFKNDKLNAADWIANKNSEGRQPMRNNTYGFEVDGPVWIPKVFDGRNKAFFFSNYEGYRFNRTEIADVTIPTLKMRTGDFSELLTDPYVLNGLVSRWYVREWTTVVGTAMGAP